MKVLVQRVSSASVTVADEAGQPQVVGRIGQGLLALVGLEQGDSPKERAWMLNKLTKLRVFEDAEGKMNLSLFDLAAAEEANGGDAARPGVLLVSQFTLCGDVKKGTRPSFGRAMAPEQARADFDSFVAEVRDALPSSLAVETGTFQAHMDVALVNDGPVTLMLEKAPA